MNEMRTKRDFTVDVDAALAQLVTFHSYGGAQFINLPLLYPDGSSVTLKVERVGEDLVLISDGGFAFREVEAVGAEASFASVASHVTQKRGVDANRRIVCRQVAVSHIHRAIADVAIASWEIVDRIYGRLEEKDEVEFVQEVQSRLVTVFGRERTECGATLVGLSSSEWQISALVKTDHGPAVFQAVSPHPNSVYRTTTAFHDLSALETPPRLVAVVHDKQKLGPKIGLLSQAGRVIEDTDKDEVFIKAAA